VRERYGEEAVRRADEDADGLQGMPHDVFGLGVGVVIYGVTEDARLLWYQHTGQPAGSANWAHPDGKLVGRWIPWQ
jgi:hypothetical protein